MNYNLPDIEWQTKDWTIPGQMKKIMEEIGEVMEAICSGQPGNAIAETLDAMQTCDTLLSMLMQLYNIPSLDTYLNAHAEKLEMKCYLKGD